MSSCPKCGSALLPNGCCSNYIHCDYTATSVYDMYDLSGSVEGELINNLIIVNEIVRAKNLKEVPVFYILGGAAMIFHSLNYGYTEDIDTANRISDNIREDISAFISDAASEVVVLGGKYKERAIRFKPELTAIEVYLLSKEDLLITKLVGMRERRKDLNALLHTGILDRHTIAKAKSILSTEYDERVCEALCKDIDILFKHEQEG